MEQSQQLEFGDAGEVVSDANLSNAGATGDGAEDLLKNNTDGVAPDQSSKGSNLTAFFSTKRKAMEKSTVSKAVPSIPLDLEQCYAKPNDKLIFEKFFAELTVEEKKNADNKSHRCTVKSCHKTFQLVNTASNRIVYHNAASHFSGTHKLEYRDFVISLEPDGQKESREAIKKSLDETRRKRLQDLAQMDPSSSAANLPQVCEALSSGAVPRPVCDVKLNPAQVQTVRFALSVASAKLNWGLSVFESDAFRDLFRTLGILDHRGLVVAPVSETVRKLQGNLATLVLDRSSARLAAIVDFCRSVRRVSLQSDAWSAHNGEQVMGIRVSAIDPLTVRPFTFRLPLVPASQHSMTSEAEASMIRSGVAKLGMTMSDIFSCTTDGAAVAEKSSVVNGVIGIRCLSHALALCLNDVITAGDSRNLDLEAPVSDTGAVNDYLLSVAARSAFFNRSAKAVRILEDYLAKHNLDSIHFITWSPTRWTGIASAAARDLRLLEMLNHSFWSDLAKSCDMTPAAKSKIIPKPTTILNARIIVSILEIVRTLSEKLQRADLTLGRGYFEILTTLETLAGDKLKLSSVEDRVEYETLDKDMLRLRNDLCTRIQDRLLDDVPDIALVNIALDPVLFIDLETLNAAACSRIGKASISTIFHKAASSAIEHDIVWGMAEVIAERQASQGILNEVEEVGECECDEDIVILDGEYQTRQDEHVDDIQARMKRIKMARLKKISREKPKSKGDAVERRLDMAKDEMRSYVDARSRFFEPEPKSDCEESDDLPAVYRFWESNWKEFPNIFVIFLQSFSVRASNARLESDFSVASAAVPQQRESTATSTLNNILIIKHAEISGMILQKAAHDYAA